jgi:hypothetical protein
MSIIFYIFDALTDFFELTVDILLVDGVDSG